MLISVCLQKEVIIESEGKTHLLLIKPHQNHPMTDSLGVWLTCRTETESEKVQQWQRENWIRGLKGGRVMQSGQDRAAGTRHRQLSSHFMSLLINSISLLRSRSVTSFTACLSSSSPLSLSLSLSLCLSDCMTLSPLSSVSSASYIRLTW